MLQFNLIPLLTNNAADTEYLNIPPTSLILAYLAYRYNMNSLGSGKVGCLLSEN